MTKDIENWRLLATRMLIDASSRESRSEYPHKPYITGSWSPWQTFLLVTVWKYIHSFSHSCLSKVRHKNLVKLTMKTDVGIKWHLKVIQGQAFYGRWKADTLQSWCCIIILASAVKVPKIWWPKLLTIAGSDHPTVVWGPIAMEPPRI